MHAPVFINDTSLVFIDISPEDQVNICFENARHLQMAGVNNFFAFENRLKNFVPTSKG